MSPTPAIVSHTPISRYYNLRFAQRLRLHKNLYVILISDGLVARRERYCGSSRYVQWPILVSRYKRLGAVYCSPTRTNQCAWRIGISRFLSHALHSKAQSCLTCPSHSCYHLRFGLNAATTWARRESLSYFYNPFRVTRVYESIITKTLHLRRRVNVWRAQPLSRTYLLR